MSNVLQLKTDITKQNQNDITLVCAVVVVVVDLLFYVHGKHLRSCRDGQLT